jgi:hypothetical protein
MKNPLLLFAALLMLINPSLAQECNYVSPNLPTPTIQNSLAAGPCISNNGYLHPPKGNLHIMYIVVDFNNEPPDAESSW